MLYRRVFVPISLILVLMMQFLPGTFMGPRPAAASACDWAQFTADVTVPDGTSFAPGTPFLKTWRLKNIGACTWTTSYSAVLTSGAQMNAPAAIYFSTSVAPGDSINISANMVAPSTPGHYRGNWILRNASGGLFGVGSSADAIFWVDIYVTTSYSSTYDFVSNFASATWTSGAGGLPAPGTDGDPKGFVLKVNSPQLEDGSVDPSAGLVVSPQNVTGGYIQGVYPAYTVQPGDHFLSILNCAYGASGCYVNFRLNYQIGSGPVQTLWSFNERYDGLYFRANIDLSSLAGQSVNFILYMADVSGHGTPSGDRAEWVETKIAGSGGGVPIPPIPPTTTCDKGAFVSDVTVPDGTYFTTGTAFTKTWQIRNVGTCTWTTSYALAFAFGNQMSAPSLVYLPSNVNPGDTVNFSVNLVAPSVPGHYRSYWRFRNASGAPFGVGTGNVTFFADINVTSGSPGTSADLQVNINNGITTYTPGGAVTYNIDVWNNGPQSVFGALFSDGKPSQITSWTWTCTPDSGAACLSGSSNLVGNFADTVSIPAGRKVSYTAVALISGSATTDLVDTATIAVPAGTTDPNPANNSASHTDASPASSTNSTTTITASTPNPSAPTQTVNVSVTVTGGGATPTGWVAIGGADTTCTITLTGGSGNCNVVFNTAGTKTLVAIYSGDSHYTSSASTTTHTVISPSTSSTTTITAQTPNPSAPGQTVSVSVKVSGSGATPTGTVAITGTDSNCNITLASGTGSCNVSFSSTGTKTITATYSGDLTYGSSTTSKSHDVVPAATLSTTTITADSPDPSVPGQVVDVEVTVSGTPTIPTGTVDITGADHNCTITLSGGTGGCGVIFDSSGSKTIKATYSGNSNYAVSSDTASHTVSTGGAATATTITSSIPDPSTPGQAVVISVTVSGAGLPAPSGTVTISGADTNCTMLLAGGTGSCNVKFNSTGHKTIVATYSGDGTFAASSGSATHNVIKGSTTTTILSQTPNPSQPTQPVAISFSVIGGGATPTGTMTITGADVNCSITLSGGNGSCSVIFNTIGVKTLTATYSGDSNYLTSSVAATQTVKNSTTVAISSDVPDPSLPSDAVTVTVTVTGPGAPPTGTVDITGADTNCTTGGLAPLGPNSATANCAVIFNTAGAKVLTATYGGDANYVGSTGTTSHTVNKGPSITAITVVAPEPSNPFQSVAVTVTVSGAAVTPTGSVGITISGVSSSCNIALVAGTGTCNVVFNATGTFTIKATYNGDNNYSGSFAIWTHTVS